MPDIGQTPTDMLQGGERRIAARIREIGESPTLGLNARAKARRAAGHPVVIFAAGEPDFPTPDHIVEAARAAVAESSNHRYTPPAGLPALRRAIADKTTRDSGHEVAPEQVLVSNGAKQAIYHGLAAILDPGDEVLLPAPYWPTYPAAVRLAGGAVVELPTDERSAFKVSVEQLERARTERTRVLVLTSPGNPTGSVYTYDEVERIGRWAVEHRIWVLVDEIYEQLVYDGRTAPSLPAVVPAARERCLVVNGVAKTYAMTGWRVGWLVGPPDVIAAAVRHQSHVTSNVNNIAQVGAIEALSGDRAVVERMRTVFDRRRRTMVGMLNEIDGVDCLLPDGAFYAFPSVRRLVGRSVAGETVSSSLHLAELLLDRADVAVVPGEVFGAPGYLRLSFALGDDALEEGVARIQRLLAT